MTMQTAVTVAPRGAGARLTGTSQIVAPGGQPTEAQVREGWEAMLDRFAADLREQGVRRISGDLIGDASFFDASGSAPGWEERHLLWWYGARASALAFNDNVVTLEVRPGPTVGSPPIVTPAVKPVPLVDLANTPLEQIEPAPITSATATAKKPTQTAARKSPTASQTEKQAAEPEAANDANGDAAKSDGSGEEQPRRRGWWQRTFGE